MENFVRSKLVPILAALLFSIALPNSVNAVIALEEYGINVDGSISYLKRPGSDPADPVPAGVNVSGFSDSSGLGVIEVKITGTGNHSVGAFFDHEIDEDTNTFFNEIGTEHGTAASNQGWEIDDPFYGYIVDDFETDSLLTYAGNYNASPNDVSMAMSWEFLLAQGEQALITFALSETSPLGGFFLEHNDPDSQKSIYLSSTLDISPIPLPAAVWLFGSALLGLVGFSRRKRQGSAG